MKTSLSKIRPRAEAATLGAGTWPVGKPQVVLLAVTGMTPGILTETNNFNDESLRKLLSEPKAKLRSAGKDAESLIPALPTMGRLSLDLPPTAVTLLD